VEIVGDDLPILNSSTSPRASLHLFGLIAKSLCMTSRFFLSILISVILFPSVAFADDFKTVNGKEYKNVTVSRVEPDGIVVKSKSGITKLYFHELPKEVQERFHYDPAQAGQFNAAQQDTVTQQNAAIAEQQQKQEKLRRAEEIKKNMRTVREAWEVISQGFLINRFC
jgi:hypothetical protein